MPPTDPFTEAYPNTTSKHYPNLHLMAASNDAADNWNIIPGPFGFKDGVRLSKLSQQCLVKAETEQTKDGTHDPASMTAGFSVSIWIRTNYTERMLLDTARYHAYEKEYLVSTGGDMQGGRGISLYQHGILLVGVVSTGSQYWMVMAPGAVPNNKWTNVGMRWAHDLGLELVVNSRTKSSVLHPEYSTGTSHIPTLETTIGCRRDHIADDVVYTDFSTVDVDEYAMWDHYLGNDESIFFLGGYVGETAHLTPNKLTGLLQGTDITNPEQSAIAVSLLKEYLESKEKKALEMEDGSSSGGDNTTETQEEKKHKAETQAEDFDHLLATIVKLTDPKNLRKTQTLEQTTETLEVLSVSCHLLKESTGKDWREHIMRGGQSAMAFTDHLESYILASAMSHGLSENPTHHYSATYDCMHIEVDSMTVEDLAGPMDEFSTPKYPREGQLMKTWGNPLEKLEVPRRMFTDHRCLDRTVYLVSFLYNTLQHLQVDPLPVNPGSLNAKAKVENLVDSSCLSLHISANQRHLVKSGELDPSSPPCLPDSLEVKIKPTLKYVSKMAPIRRPLFHENETMTKLYERHCVWWNPAIGSAGAWDAEGCHVWHKNTEYAKCICRHLGKYSIVAEMMEPMEVPDEPQWLLIVRYILYCLSALCLLLFILVVAFAGDLKEQFHLMGLCLAVCLLAGSVFMVLTDLDAVRDVRHSCTALGTLLHTSYLGAGAWVAMLGHASFKCVTSGIVGGMLKQYGYLAGGLTLISVGCSYTFFLPWMGTDPRCFISWFDIPKGVFFAPQVVFCAVALCYSLIVLLNLHTAALRNKPSLDDHRSFSRGVSLLILYFCLTWSIGVVTYLRFDLEFDFYPVFQILNALSGVMLLLCLGLLSSRFRTVLAGQANMRRAKLLQYMGRTGQGEQQNKLVITPRVSPQPSPRPVPRPFPRPSPAPQIATLDPNMLSVRERLTS